MALSDSQVSVVIALDESVLSQRFEGAVRGSPEFACAGMEAPIPFAAKPTAIRVVRDEGTRPVLLEAGFDILDVTIFGGQVYREFTLKLAISASNAGSNGLTARLEFQYLDVTSETIEDDQMPELRQMIREAIEDGGTQFGFDVPLQDVVAEGRESTNPPALRARPADDSGPGALFIGVAVDGDADEDSLAFFADEFEPSALPEDVPWTFEIESSLIRERIQDVLDEKDFEEEIEGWLGNGEKTVFWTGEPVPQENHGQQGYVDEHVDEHPVWLFVTGFTQVIEDAVALGVYAALYVDLDTYARSP